MYASTADPYCYAGTHVLKNRAGLRDQILLDAFEADATAQRADEPAPHGSLGFRHYCALHRHLFQDVYPWAGRLRSVRISKGDSVFCYPEHIRGALRRLFADLRRTGFMQGFDRDTFADAAAHMLAELNAIHPFREGNGRTQLAYLTIVADRAGFDVAFNRVAPEAVLQAMIDSFGGDERSLARLISQLLAVRHRFP